jgi:hypothetical protein
MLSVGERGYGNTQHTWVNNSHKVSTTRLNHIKLKSEHKVRKHSLLQHDGYGVQGHYNTQVKKHHDTTGL